MSASTREKTPRKSRSDRPAQAIAPELGRTSPWWVVSLFLHGAVLVALLLLTPLRTIILQPGKDVEFETTASADRIEEVVAEIRDHQAEEISWEVQELLDIREQLDEIRDAKLDAYDEFALDAAKDAPNEALKAQDEALKAQQQALDAIDRARAVQAAAEKAQADVAKARPETNHQAAAELQAKARQVLDGARKAHKSARDAQLAADEAQERAERALAMLGGEMASARDAQAAATRAQGNADAEEIEAGKAQYQTRQRQEQAEKKQQAARDLAKVAGAEPAALTQARAKAKTAADEAAKAKQAAEQANQQYRQARTDAENAQRAVRRKKDPAEQARAKAAAEAAKKRADGLRKLSEKAKARARDAETKARAARSAISRPLREWEAARKQYTRAVEDAQRLQAQAGEGLRAAKTTAQAAREAQQKARDAQQKARDATAGAIARAGAVAAAPSRDDSAQGERRPDLHEKNVAELYKLAVGTERKSTESYKDIRAAELAMIRKIPLAQARDQTDVARPIRPELDDALLTAPVRDIATAERHKQEVEKAVREVDSMVTLGRRLLNLAGTAEAQAGAEVSLDWYRAKAVQQEELTAAAAEDDGQKAKDLSALMKQAMAGTEGSDSGADAGAAAAAAAQGDEEGKDEGKIEKEGPAPRARWTGPPTVQRDLKAIPGRKVLADGLPSEWMYVDSWYVIGPFPNPRRINRDKKFPPESVVDLDARYVGKDGRVIRWTFMQSPNPKVLPPKPEEYAIYYAYTELWFEKAMDLWVAVGSDDKSSLWVEDQPVWVSANHLKAWQIAEGLRRVHFKKGRNRVLYRIENGWQHVAWSLVLHTKKRR